MSRYIWCLSFWTSLLLLKQTDHIMPAVDRDAASLPRFHSRSQGLLFLRGTHAVLVRSESRVGRKSRSCSSNAREVTKFSVPRVESGSTQLTVLLCRCSRLRECSKPPPTPCLRRLSSDSVPSDSVPFSFLQVPIFISSSGLADAALWMGSSPVTPWAWPFQCIPGRLSLPACTSLTLPTRRSSHLSNWNQLESPCPTYLPVRWTVLKWLTVCPAVESSLLPRNHLQRAVFRRLLPLTPASAAFEREVWQFCFYLLREHGLNTDEDD